MAHFGGVTKSKFRRTNRCSRQKIRTEVDEEQIQADICRQTDADSCREIRTEVNKEQIQAKRCIQRDLNRFRCGTRRNWAEPKHVVDAEMLHITTQGLVKLVKTITSPSPSPTQNQSESKHYMVLLYGGQVVSWKNERREELLFMSSKCYSADFNYFTALQ
ncbi:hypothetical protein Tco_0743853 [Tanacetum coccineum]